MSGHRSIGQGERFTYDPTSGDNSEYTLTWSGDELIQIDKTVGEFTYRKTLTWTAGNLTDISDWVKL